MARYGITRSITSGTWSAVVEAESMEDAKKKAEVGIYIEGTEDFDFDLSEIYHGDIVREDDE